MAALIGTLSVLSSVLIVPPGRRLFAFRATQPLVGEGAPEALGPLIETAIAHEAATLEVEARWQAQRKRGRNPEARRVDRALDRLLGTFARHLDATPEMTNDPDKAAAAERIALALFPGGLVALIRQPYVLQHAESALRLDKLRGPLADDVGLLGLEDSVEKLGGLVEAYGAALAAAGADGGVAYEAVRAARARGHNNMVRVVFMIGGHFGDLTPEDTQARSTLLAPLMAQQEAVSKLRRQRRAVSDVDPDTGEPLPTSDADDPVLDVPVS